MCARLDSYLKPNNILCANQFGFGKNSNTSDAIIEFLDYVYSSLDSKQRTIAVYLDFSKAFDTVNHNILLSKLLHNGVSGIMQHWFESYLICCRIILTASTPGRLLIYSSLVIHLLVLPPLRLGLVKRGVS